MDPRDVFEEVNSYAASRTLRERDFDIEGAVRRSDVKVVAVTGCRRSGKSSILMLIARFLRSRGMNVAYINAEDSRLDPTTMLDDAIKWFGDDGYLLIDEVTSAEDWAGWLARNHELLKGRLRLIVSSSRSGLREPPKALRGRIMTMEVFPLSFHEYIDFKGISPGPTTADRGRLEEALQEYMRYGGFPEVALMEEGIEKAAVLRDYYREILGLDVGQAAGSDPASISLFGRCLLNGLYFSANRCLNYFKSTGCSVAKSTLLQWEHHAQEGYLFFFVPVFGRSVKSAGQYPRKAHPVDVGFFYGAAGIDDRGRALEALVFLARRRRLEPPDEISYWRGEGGIEVDLVIRRGHTALEAVQVCADLSDPRTLSREAKALSACLDELALPKGTIVTMGARTSGPLGDDRIEVVDFLRWSLRP